MLQIIESQRVNKIFKKMDKIAHCAVIHFLFIKRLFPKEIYKDMVVTLEDNAPSYCMYKKWAAELKQHKENLEGNILEVATHVNIDKIHNMMIVNRQITEHYIATELSISKKCIGTIINKHLKMIKVSVYWIPKLLQPDQKWLWHVTTISRGFLSLTVNETWVNHFQPDANQWKHARSQATKKTKSVMSGRKVIASIFQDAKGVLLIEQKGSNCYQHLLWH